MNAQLIGWTLIHSLWQGLAIYLLLRIALKLTENSEVKYLAGIVSMLLLVISSLVTYFVLSSKPASSELYLVLGASQTSDEYGSSILTFINQNIVWLIRFWAIGIAIGFLRIASGLWYIGRLRSHSHPVQQEWIDMVGKLSESLKINRMVAIAEARISSPMVIGFMKPVILFPIGLLSGLTAEQVETILVHELAHIRRQDYIINMIQSVIETIYFFNPFALLISANIREERENCCDDLVLAKGASPILYATTLAQLEEARTTSSLAMGLMGNQNQLLNRIKRIMENSAKNDWGKSRLVPVALLFLGFICASWLSINSEKEIDTAHSVLASDTIKEGNFIVFRNGPNHDDWLVIEEPLPALDPINFDLPEIPEIPELLAIDLELQNQQLEIMQEQLLHQNLMLEDMNRRMNAYNGELIKMLAEDGYLKEKSEFENISINDVDGRLIINGHEIDEKHLVKYRALHDMFFRDHEEREFRGRPE